MRSAAETLFREVQKAWDARDTERLATLLGPELLAEWKRRLADFEAKDWHSRAEVRGPVETEYVGLTNREDEDEDRAVVLIQATLRAYVLDNSGNVILRRGERDDTIRLSQYWTLGVREERWVLLSIEEFSEGKHNLTDPLVATPWTDGDRLRDEAVIETAAADELPAEPSLPGPRRSTARTRPSRASRPSRRSGSSSIRATQAGSDGSSSAGHASSG